MESRVFAGKPIEIGDLVRCGAVFWQCSVELHFTRLLCASTCDREKYLEPLTKRRRS
jgi:hypothetical protein